MSGVDSLVEKLVPLAEQFGPFLFAILFLLVITRTAHSYYRECNTRVPPAKADEIKVYRTYFVCSMWFGVAVTTLSIGWWIYVHMKGTHTYQVTVLNLQQDEEVSADYYSRRAIRVPGAGVSPVHDLYFIIVQDTPFNVGDHFTFLIYKKPSTSGPDTPGVVPRQIVVTYSGHQADTFHAEFGADGPQLKLVENGGEPSHLATAHDIQLAKARYAAARQAVVP